MSRFNLGDIVWDLVNNKEAEIIGLNYIANEIVSYYVDSVIPENQRDLHEVCHLSKCADIGDC